MRNKSVFTPCIDLGIMSYCVKQIIMALVGIHLRTSDVFNDLIFTNRSIWYVRMKHACMFELHSSVSTSNGWGSSKKES